MKAKRRQSGVTLTEMTVVIAVAAMLAALGLPAIRTFFNSLATEGSTKAMIGAALSSARAIAAERQRYAGVRFQKAYHPTGPLKASQYMIFIINDPAIGAYFFRAVEGTQPMKLPENLGVMDLRIRVSLNEDNSADMPIEVVGNDTLSNSNIDNMWELRDTTSFSIVFSPSGKMVRHDVRIRNRDGYRDSSSDTRKSYDDVFNKLQEVNYEIGIFYQDDYAGDLNGTNLGLGKEPSRSSFVIYDRTEFNKVNPNSRWSDYLYKLRWFYINPYTGTIIDSR